MPRVTYRESNIQKAIDAIGGISIVARHLGLSAEGVRRWKAQGHLPRTELYGATMYAEVLIGMWWEAGTEEKPSCSAQDLLDEIPRGRANG